MMVPQRPRGVELLKPYDTVVRSLMCSLWKTSELFPKTSLSFASCVFSYRSGLSVLDVVSVWIWHLHSFTKKFLGNLSLFPLSKLDGGKKKRKGEFLSWIPLSLSSLTIVYTLPSLTQTLHLVCYIILSLSAFMCNVCCVMTSSSFYLCCWFHISEPSGHTVHSRGHRRTTPGM